jgi:hypothetical protein
MIESREITGTRKQYRFFYNYGGSVEIESRNPAPDYTTLPPSPPLPRKPHIHSSINNQQSPHWIETTRDESGDAGTCLGRRRCTRRGGSRDGLRRLRLLSSSSQRLGLRTRGGGAEETILDLRAPPVPARRGQSCPHRAGEVPWCRW